MQCCVTRPQGEICSETRQRRGRRVGACLSVFIRDGGLFFSERDSYGFNDFSFRAGASRAAPADGLEVRGFPGGV